MLIQELILQKELEFYNKMQHEIKELKNDILICNMSSKNKKNKLKNSYQVASGLKTKLRTGVKRMSFYTSSARQELKNKLRNELL